MIEKLFQIGGHAEHRGIVVAPLYPRRDPVAVYLALDEALARGLRIRETSESGSVPELLVVNPLSDPRPPVRRGGARRGEAEPHPECQRPRRGEDDASDSCVEQGRWRHVSPSFQAAGNISHASLSTPVLKYVHV